MWRSGDRDNPDQLIFVSLSEAERQLLICGLVEWGGPAFATIELAQAMGFNDVSHLLDEGHRIASDLQREEALSRRDWTRALLATEVAFASDVLGSGVEWSISTGLDDVESLRHLRSAQRTLVGVVVRPQR